ncbi:MAG: glutamate formimidoyltransferase [Anaerolineae bacterium]|jgi:glutamate formiminotransferase/formiminotetrahydrofolate cyclodeaminase|nr:glutamate formimidoyltransferase [Anaerolineae bacterium]
MDRLVECVPNFSEGRRADVIAQIVAAMEAIPGVQVLDVQSDADHNRTVVTLVGPPEAVEEAAFASIARAAALIDMDEHQGEHPRVGATDVVPFVPIRGVTMEDCVRLARRLGRRVGETLAIPVYLYESAATRPDRVNLANLRRGEYEGLKEAIETDPDRAPDFGPPRLGTAGATIIGARPFLIAFNVYLDTGDVAVAKRIARAVRHSSGGLRFVKALGLLVAGQAQVSMNLTDFTRTPIHQALELIRREAARYGVTVVRSELIGLTPQRALLDAAAWYLQLDLDPRQVLENRLQDVEQPDIPPCLDFLDAVAADTPAPGGGSVAALAGALAAALTTMVARLTLGRKKYEAVQVEMETLAAESERLRAALAARVAQDAEAYDRVVAAYRLPKATGEERDTRQEAIQQALARAAEVPLSTARDAVAALELARTAAHMGNANVLTDAGTAAYVARAAFEGAALNVRANADQVIDRGQAAAWLAELKRLRGQCEAAFAEAVEAIEERWRLDADSR